MIDNAEKVVSAPAGPLVNTELRNAIDPQISAKYKYSGAFSWPPRFFGVCQDKVSKDWENSPFTDALGKETQEPEEDHISRLVWTEENWAPDQHRVDCVLGITQASEATIQKLIDRDESVSQQKIALLIDGNDAGPQLRLREFLGGLSPQALFDELKKRRYKEDDNDDIVEANRRLIYIANLDAWGIVALVGTSPESLFLVLGDFLFNFICGSPSIGVSFSTQGPETFAMQFSFPYRAWRSTKQLMMDGRIDKSTGKAVRSSRDVTFLRRLARFEEDRKDKDTDGIYATNISCIVTGYDQSRWTGLVLLETWYEEANDDPSPDMVARYENDFQDGMLLDPLCRGKDDVVKGKWSPRPYFIRVLEVRVVQVHREWASLFYHLQERMNALITRHKECTKRARDPILTRKPTIPMHDRTTRELDELENGINDMKEIWVELAQDLQETVRCGELFMKSDVLYFRNHDEPSDDASTCFPPLTQIRKTFNNLEQLRQKLDDMQKKCREMAEDVASASKMYRRQLQLAATGDYAVSEPRVLTWTTVTSFPVIITTGIFSCDDIIPFGRSWKSFVAVLLVVGATVAVAVVVITKLTTGSWRLKSPRHLSSEFEEGPGPLETLRAQDGPAGEGIELAVLRRQTFLTAVVGVFQTGGVRGIVGENT